MNILNYKKQIMRALIAALICICFFFVLPAFQLLMSDFNGGQRQLQGKSIIMEVERKKPKEKKVPKKQIRRIKTKARSMRSQASKFSFSPDLGVEGDGDMHVSDDDMENRIFGEGEADENPIPISNPLPQYPYKARQLGIEGLVELDVIVDATGRISSAKILSVPDPMFKEPVLSMVRTWRFRPGKYKGVSVNVKMKLKIPFTLSK